MALKTNTLRDAITFALVITGAAAAGSASAQATSAGSTTEGATNLDRIQVTGSRIRQVDTETAQPVLLIDRAAIERQGFQSVADILQNISAAGAPPISRASPLSAGEAAGGTYISLRNLGAERTLVLVNGRRMPITTGGLADISAIPAVAVERIEVLKDGASSIYGSDAIGGVVNIITRTNYEGAAASAYYGQYGEGDGAITKGDFVLGFASDRGSVTIAAEWGKEEGVAASDRPYSAFPRSDMHPTDSWTTVGEFGGFQPRLSQRALFPQLPDNLFPAATTANPNPAGPRVVLREGGNPNLPGDYILQNQNVGGCTTAGCTPGSTLHKSNTNQQTDLRTPVERRGLFVDANYDLTDNIRLRSNFLYSYRDSQRTVAGYPMQAASFATPMSGQSYFNPTGTTIDNWWRRTWEVPRVSRAEQTTYRFSAALEGSFEVGERFFDWDAGYQFSRSNSLQSSYGNLNVPRVRQAVGPSYMNAQGQVVCGTPATGTTPATVVNGCVPWNPYLPFGATGPGSLTGNTALQNYLFQEEHATGETETEVFNANLAGSVFTLPAGDLGFAVGVESRKETGTFVPDALAVTGDSTNLAAGPTGGSYRVNEVYAELEVPVLADLPFAQELTLSLASRYSDYDTFGDTTNNKLGIKWKVFDSLLLRGTVADGFRAPTISNLFGGGSQTFVAFTDPCDTNFGSSAGNATTRANCVAAMGALANTYRQIGQGFNPVNTGNQQTPVAFTQGSNPLLIPEVSNSQTIGFVWSPTFVEGLNIALDWWKIRISETIVQDSPTTILNDCYINGITSRCSPQLFTREAARGFVDFMQYGNRNAGFRKVEGFDFDVSYRWGTDYGNFAFTSNSSYTAKDFFVSTNDPRLALSGVGNTSQFRIRSNTGVSWDMGDFGVTWGARFYSSMKEGCTYFISGSTEPNLECNEITMAPTGNLTGTTSSISRRKRTGSVTFNDVQVRYNAPWDATISIGANNVFDKVGPVMYSQPSSNTSYYGGFDIGRFLYMRYTQRF